MLGQLRMYPSVSMLILRFKQVLCCWASVKVLILIINASLIICPQCDLSVIILLLNKIDPMPSDEICTFLFSGALNTDNEAILGFLSQKRIKRFVSDHASWNLITNSIDIMRFVPTALDSGRFFVQYNNCNYLKANQIDHKDWLLKTHNVRLWTL